MSDALIELTGLQYAYAGAPPLLWNLDFTLHAGERVGITGANGTGKSTLLHLVVGLLRPSGGAVRVAGQERRQESDFEDVRRRVGLLFQDPDDQLFCTTVEEDLAFGPFNLGLPRPEVEHRVAATLDRLGIRHLRERITYRLSEGEKRLVSLGTLLTMEPAALLLDEPTNGLDEDARARLTRLLRALPQALVIVSHDQSFVSELAPRRLRLADGRLHAVS